MRRACVLRIVIGGDRFQGHTDGVLVLVASELK